MYKAEWVLGMIGAIFSCVSAFFLLVIGLPLGAGLGGLAMVIIGLLCAIAAIVLGFMGMARLRRGDKGGAMLLVIAAGLTFISLFNVTVGGYVGIVSLVLYLIGGIMALIKREPFSPHLQ